MNAKLIGILLESGISVIAGIFVTYLGFLSPIFRRSSERLAPDRWVGAFRVAARIAGPLLCIVAGLRIFYDIRQAGTAEVLQWREFTSPEGRFRISAPADFVKEVKPYGVQHVNEYCFQALVAPLGFLVSYLDLPADVLKSDPKQILNKELDSHVQVPGIELLHKDTTRFAGYPAVRFKAHYVRGGYFVEGVLLLAKERRYQLAVQFTSDASAQNREQFFNSFRVLDGP